MLRWLGAVVDVTVNHIIHGSGAKALSLRAESVITVTFQHELYMYITIVLILILWLTRDLSRAIFISVCAFFILRNCYVVCIKLFAILQR